MVVTSTRRLSVFHEDKRCAGGGSLLHPSLCVCGRTTDSVLGVETSWAQQRGAKAMFSPPHELRLNVAGGSGCSTQATVEASAKRHFDYERHADKAKLGTGDISAMPLGKSTVAHILPAFLPVGNYDFTWERYVWRRLAPREEREDAYFRLSCVSARACVCGGGGRGGWLARPTGS